MIQIPGMTYAAIGLLLSTLTTAGLWQYERANAKELKGRVHEVEMLNSVLDVALETNEKAFDTTLALVKKDNESVAELREQNDTLNTLIVENAAENMRSSYERELKAKEDRIRGGRISGARINKSFCRASGLPSNCNDDSFLLLPETESVEQG